MRRIYIIFLSRTDFEIPAYRSIRQEINLINPDDILFATSSEQILDFIGSFNTDNNAIILTILGHGGVNGLGAVIDNLHETIGYLSILDVLSRMRTTFPIYLNLVGACNSFNAIRFMDGHGVDEIWYTTGTTLSLNKALLAANTGQFDLFSDWLPPEEADLYQVLR